MTLGGGETLKRIETITISSNGIQRGVANVSKKKNKPPEPKMPKRVKVGPIWMTVEKTDLISFINDSPDPLGAANIDTGKIYIRTRDHCMSGQCQTLWHELMHAIWSVTNDSKLCENERIVDTTASHIMSILTDSPGFLEYLIEVRNAAKKM